MGIAFRTIAPEDDPGTAGRSLEEPDGRPRSSVRAIEGFR
jgi:hypothetical protein